ncbi:MAG TPA: copper homeostasis protein CutC [Pseudonocardiaceae bacterium]|nr:copper homeostasis protein CutC [Pseudonocardiaceae bacterium]
MISIELSVDTVDAALAADALDIQRVELCSAGGLGGLTPGPGLLETTIARCHRAAVHVLIRPRAGDFRYSSAEIAVLLGDIEAAVDAGAAGVVVGALTEHDEVDKAVLTDLIAAAQGREVTFHRAIDLSGDPLVAVERLIESGVHRVLSSGHAARAELGAPVLAEMVRLAGSQLAVMACGGIRAHSAQAILAATGVTHLHAAPRKPGRPGSTPPAAKLAPQSDLHAQFGSPPDFDLVEAEALIAAVRKPSSTGHARG